LFTQDETELLKQLNSNIQTLNINIKEVMIKTKELETSQTIEGFDVDALLKLPDHIRKTLLVILKKGVQTTQDVADETKRARAVESNYLNQLLHMKYLKSERKGRIIYFSINI
jgi:hypothetical protein